MTTELVQSETDLIVPQAPAPTSWTEAARGRRPFALVVDDEEMVQFVLRRALEDVGMSVSTAGTGKEALASFRRAPTDLLVLDLLLPDMDGLDVLLELEWHNRDLKAIAISGGSGHLDFLDVAEKFGAVRAMRKPFAVDAFVEVAEEVLSGQRSALADDRRRHPRLPVRLPVEFAGVHTRGQGYMVNMSIRGCTVESDVAPRPDESLLVQLSVPDHPQLLRLEFTLVRWIGRGRFGVEFLLISHKEQQLMNQILRHIVM